MRSVRIWTPESDKDCKAIVCLANKIVKHYELDLKIESGTKQGYITAAKKNELKKAVDNYLKDNDLVIFLIDADGAQSMAKRRGEQNSLVNRIDAVARESDGRVKLILILQELEAWLLVDCLGICCYFTGSEKTRNNSKWIEFARSKQPGKTNLITEAESGGKGAKESLIQLSKEILIRKNPKLKDKPKNLKQNQYSDDLSPQVAKCLEISSETINRNDSLIEFAECLKEVSQGDLES